MHSYKRIEESIAALEEYFEEPKLRSKMTFTFRRNDGDEELESKGWNRKEVALAAKDVVDICLLKHINDDDDDDDDDRLTMMMID